MNDPAARIDQIIDQSLARQREAIKRAGEVLAADSRMLAVFLVGSHAAGTADAYSDVDVHCVVADADVDGCLADAGRLMTSIAGPLALSDRMPGMTGAVGVAMDWLRLDLCFHPLSEYDRAQYDAVAPLFDHADLLPPARRPDAEASPPWFPADAVKLFFYFLGNLVVVLGREETTLAHNGIGIVRAQLIELMCAENGVRRTGGAKRLSPFLTEEQRRLLAGMPAAGPVAEQIIAAHRFLAADFIPRGKTLATRTGQPWPQRLEVATLEHLRRHLAVPHDWPIGESRFPR